jgi:subtilisin family serine protease
MGSFNALTPGAPAFDENSHGTHVSSIISASGSNNYGIKGIVPGNVQIVAVKFIGATSSGDTNSAIRALDWIYKDMKARREKDSSVKFILSNSWGGGYSRFLEEKMKALSDFDYLPITSAGNQATNNDQQPYYPCNYKIAANTCVGATDYFDRRASFSGYGATSVHLFAPGVQILGVVPGQISGGNYSSAYKKKDGTSQAVPHVSGVAALVWSVNPKLSASEVQEILVNSVDKLPGGEGESISGGRLNAYRAVLVASGQDASLANRTLGQSAAAGAEGGCSIAASATFNPSFVLMGLVFLLAMFWLKRSRSQGFNQ